MTHRLILLYGAGSGLGKSTLAAGVARSLGARLVREEDVLELAAFAPYVRLVREDEGADSGVLLSACRDFIETVAQSGAVHVADSILPCWDWLVTADCPLDEVRRFSERLCALLVDLDPLLVFLTGDLATGLERARSERGEDWARRLARRRAGDESLESLRAYFARVRAAGDALLDEWPFEKLVLDTTAVDAAACEAAILKRAARRRSA